MPHKNSLCSSNVCSEMLISNNFGSPESSLATLSLKAKARLLSAAPGMNCCSFDPVLPRLLTRPGYHCYLRWARFETGNTFLHGGRIPDLTPPSDSPFLRAARALVDECLHPCFVA